MSYNRPMTHQEYLKIKYMSQDDYEPKSRKKKNSKKAVSKYVFHFKCEVLLISFILFFRVKIVDDDIDIKQLAKHDSDDEELYFGTKEEKPIISAVIDERPLHMRNEGSKWKAIGNPDTNQDTPTSDKFIEPEKEIKREKSKSKTLSGKRAGLSNAKEIKKELAELKKKNEKLIRNLNDEVSGKNAKTVFRDRGTGKIRDLEKELEQKQEEEEKKAIKEAEKKAVYDRWSKGVVQRDEQLQKIEDDLHEMSKPLARYENDSDLDKLLRDRERDDDPMLKEIRKQRLENEKATNPNYVEYPKYRGPPPPPNRFNIQPGYRWDGVNRSNGYEAKFYSRIANKEASQEEMYRWSTQDM